MLWKKIYIKKEYKKYLISSVLDTANNKIASNSFITAFAVYLGLSNFAIGIYAVLDTMTNIIQIFAAPLFSRIGQSKAVVLTNYTLYRLSSICFAFIPFISNDIGIRTALFFVFASIYAITGELGYITFVNWRMTLIKPEDRTNFASTRNIYKNTLVMAFSLIMGVVLDKFTASGYELYGFMILFIIVFVIAFIDIFIRINTYKPLIEDKKISVKETVVKPATDKEFRKILFVGGINRFANGIGMMYLNVFLLRYLNIDYLFNPNLKENLAFSFQLKKVAEEYYPGLTRKNYINAYRYNMHLRGRTTLIELGAQNNTVEEVMNACDPIAHILYMVLSGA